MGRRPIFATLALATGLYSLMQSLTVPAVPVMQRQFGSSQEAAAWVITAFLLSAAVATPIVGRLGEARGLRRYLLVSLAALFAGSVLAALAPSMGVLIAARVVQGLSGGIVPLSFGIIRHELDLKRVPQSIAVISALLSIAQALGIVFSGVVVELLGFRWLFVIPALLALATVIAVPLSIPRSNTDATQTVSLWSGALLAGWLVLLLLGLTLAPKWGWSSPATVVMLAAAVIVFLAWLSCELRVSAPLVDVRLMADRDIAGANLVALLIGISMFGAFGFLPQLLQTPESSGYGLGISVAESGLVMLPASIMSFVMGLSAVALVRRWGARITIGAGCLVTAAGLASLAAAHDELWKIYAANALSNAGIGLVFACLANVVVYAAPKSAVSMATAMNANTRTVGGSFGTAIFTTILVAASSRGGVAEEWGYTGGFVFLAATALLAALSSLLITAPRPEPRVRGRPSGRRRVPR